MDMEKNGESVGRRGRLRAGIRNMDMEKNGESVGRRGRNEQLLSAVGEKINIRGRRIEMDRF